MKEKPGFIIDERTRTDRLEIIDFVESKGYRKDEDEFRSREEILGGSFPLVIDGENRTYRMVGNVTCAAAAVSSGHLLDKNSFFELFSKFQNEGYL